MYLDESAYRIHYEELYNKKAPLQTQVGEVLLILYKVFT